MEKVTPGGDGVAKTISALPKNSGPWAACRRLAKTTYENFSVGSLFLPKELRYAFWAVYAYCRTTDDIGDEAEGDRLALLDAWETELVDCFDGVPTHPVTQALREVIVRFNLPKEPFLHLIEANRRDQQVTAYATFDDLLDYCALSANPVGRIVLRLFQSASPANDQLSDAICTALQLTNFWQDVDRDLSKGRIYLPKEDLDAFGYSVRELRERTFNDRFRQLMAFETARTRDFFRRGEALLDRLPPRCRAEVALLIRGGAAVLDKIERSDYNVLAARPALSRFDKVTLLARTLAEKTLRRGFR